MAGLRAEEIVMAELRRREAEGGPKAPLMIGITRGFGNPTEGEVAKSVLDSIAEIERGEFDDLVFNDSRRSHLAPQSKSESRSVSEGLEELLGTE